MLRFNRENTAEAIEEIKKILEIHGQHSNLRLGQWHQL